jgi:acyl-homoserine-lactone acylase
MRRTPRLVSRPVRPLALAGIALLLAGGLGCARQQAPAFPAGEILWDQWGVPHVFAAEPEGLFFAFGWAQAENHGDLILKLYGRARGRAAEYWGEEELESDRWVRTVGIPARAAAWYAAQPPEWKARIDAFARGIEAYAEAHPEAIDVAAARVLPVDGRDVLAHMLQTIDYTFVVNRWEVAKAARGWEKAGSNAWAVAPKRSADGRAMLVANPHLPWSDLFTWCEVQLAGPGIDAYGATLVGSPILGIAFNDHLGWSHTVNTHDGADLYELTLNGDGYRFDGEVRPFDEEEQTLRIRRADGTLGEETLRVRRSIQGPVVAEHGGKALALRIVGLDSPLLAEQYWRMARARNLGEFESALRMLQMPMFTVMYADADGHVLHLFGGLTPVRPPGDWDWSGIVPGDTSATLWTKTHPYADLPRVVDPPSGWLQNANDPPWTTTFPPALDPAAFPRYMAPRSMSFRAQRSARMLAEDASLTFDELVADKLSTRMELADRILDDLEAAVAGHGDERAHQAMAVLSSWDRTAEAASRGGVLFFTFFQELTSGGASPFARPWSEAEPRTTPDGLADPAAAAAALSRAAATVAEKYGALDVPWGDVFRLRRGGRDLPANGGPGSLGIFRVVNYQPAEGGRYAATGGDSWVAITEFGEPLRAQVLLSYGNASQPGSPHDGDQLELFADKQLRPAWRSREEIEAHLEAREDLSRQLAGGR